VPKPPIPLTAPQRELVTANLALAGGILRKHFLRYRHRREVWHVVKGAAMHGLCLAAQRYNRALHKTEFSTFAYPTIWGTANNAIRREELRAIRYIGHLDADQSFTDHAIDYRVPPVDDQAVANERADMVAGALKFLDPVDAEIVRLRFGLADGVARQGTEIGRRLGITRQRVRQRLVRATDRLRNVIATRPHLRGLERSL
jgi:RNA polymerase sigma factor (sigma-70 family)